MPNYSSPLLRETDCKQFVFQIWNCQKCTCEGFAKIAVHNGILHYLCDSWSLAMISDQWWADLFNHFMKISFAIKRKTHHIWVEHVYVVFTRGGWHINSTPAWSYFQAEFAAASKRKLKEVAFSQLFNLNTWRREATLWKTMTFDTFCGERLFWSRLKFMQMLSMRNFAHKVAYWKENVHWTVSNIKTSLGFSYCINTLVMRTNFLHIVFCCEDAKMSKNL